MKNFMRRFITSTFLLIFLLVQFLTVLPKPVYAAVPYTASDVLGQADFISSYSQGEPPVPDVTETTTYINTEMYATHDTEIDSVNHRLFVADSGNNRVLVYNLDSNNLPLDRTADYVLGQPDFDTNTADTNSRGFYHPWGVLYEPHYNRLYVAEWLNNRVLVFDVTTIDNNEEAVIVLGQADFTTGSSDVNAKGFYRPRTLTYDENRDRLFVTEMDAHRVLVFDATVLATNMDASYVIGQSNFTSGGNDLNAKGFGNPHGAVYDSEHDRLYVSDSWQNRILVFDGTALSNNMDASYVLGQTNFTSAVASNSINGLNNPQQLAYDPGDDLLFVAHWNGVVVYDTTALATHMDASYILGEASFDDVNSDITAQGFYAARGISYDADTHHLYVSDTNVNRVLIFDTTTLSNNMDAVAVLGQYNYSNSGSGVSTTTTNFTTIITPGTPATTNASGFYSPYSPTIDKIRHKLYVADAGNYRILVFNLNSANILVDKTADFVIGQVDFNSVNNPSFSQSTVGYTYGGLAVDEDSGYLYVADYDIGRVMIFDTNNLANGMNASYVLGQVDFESNDRTNGINGLQYPWTGIAIDTDNDLVFVGDVYNNRVMVFDTTNLSNGMDASYVIGQPDFETYSGSTSQSGLNYPGGGVIYDNVSKRLFVADSSNNRVVVYDLSSGISNGMNASFVLGQLDFESSDWAVTQAGLYGPEGLAYDHDQQLLFVQDNSNRILVFDVNTITNGEPAVGVIGQSDFISNDDLGVSQRTAQNAYNNLWYDVENRRLYTADDGSNRILIFSFAHLKDLPSTLSTNNSVNETLGEGNQGTTTYTLDSGTLPTGLSFNTQTGVLSGTPTSEGTYTFTITITDDNGVVGTYTDTKTFVLTIISPVTKPEGERSTTETPVCTAQAPSTPDLFQVTSLGNTSASIHFSPPSGSVSKYFISFGETEEAEGYSATLDMGKTDGAITYTLELLKPYTTYYVKVNATNNCMPSAWSTTIPFRTSTFKSYYPGLSISNLTTPSQVFGTSTNSDSSMKKDDSSMKGTTTTPNKVPKPTITKPSNPKPQTCFLFWCW